MRIDPTIRTNTDSLRSIHAIAKPGPHRPSLERAPGPEPA